MNETGESLTMFIAYYGDSSSAGEKYANDNNILDCDFIDGELKNVVSASPVPLHCSLIDEKPQSSVRP